MSTFQMLPPELKENVFKFLGLEQLKAVRLVSQDWKIIAFRFIGITKAPLNDATIPILKKSNYLPNELILTTLKDGRALKDFPGKSVQRMKMHYPTISTSALVSLVRVCENLEEMKLRHFKSRGTPAKQGFLSTLQEAIPHCLHLKILQIHVFPTTFENYDGCGLCTLQCKPLLECKNLEDLRIVTLGPMFLIDFEIIAKSAKLKQFIFMFLIDGHSFIFKPLVANHLKNQITTEMRLHDVDIAVPSQDQLDELMGYFPLMDMQQRSVRTDNDPDPTRSWGLLLDNIRPLIEGAYLYPDFKEQIRSLVCVAFTN